MNLRTAKVVKYSVDNLPLVLVALAVLYLVLAGGYAIYVQIGWAVLYVPAVIVVVLGLVWGINKLYKKASKVVEDMEQADRQYEYATYGKPKGNDVDWF